RPRRDLRSGRSEALRRGHVGLPDFARRFDQAVARGRPSDPSSHDRSVPGLIRPPSVPLLGAFSVGIARKRPRLLRITAPSSNARTIGGAFVYTRLAASSLWFG